MLSGLLHASWNAATKGSASPTAFLLAMEIVSLVVLLPMLLLGFDPREVPRAVWELLLLSALIHAVYAYWLTRTYAHAELSVAYPIVRSTPAFVPFVAVVPAVLGMVGGQLVRRRLPEAVFRKAFFGVLLLLGLYAIYRAF